jgi:valyl-tRNA synthetase
MELCDWYIEVSKSRLNDPAQRQTPQWVLLKAIEAFITMMHPIMPHITEEIYSHLPIANKAPFLMVADWPVIDASFHRPESETRVERWFEITRALAALEISPGKTIPAVYAEGDLAGGESVLASQGWCEQIIAGKPAGKFVSTTIQGVDLHIELGDMVDLAKLREKLTREEEKLADDSKKLRARLENPMFVERAKPEVVERERETLADVESRLAKVIERLGLLG